MFKKIRNRRSDIDNLPSQTFLHSPPCAGETRTEGLTETLFLAPLPVYPSTQDSPQHRVEFFRK